MNIFLARPTILDMESVMSYRREFLEINDKIHGSSDLEDISDFDDWLQSITAADDPLLKHAGRVQATQFVARRDNDDDIVGMVQIRHELNDYLLNVGGHIGYSVKPSERRKGYATQMLALALEDCKQLGIRRVLLTCNDTNTASCRVIERNGGILENKSLDNAVLRRRYWIDLNDTLPTV